MNKKTLLFTIWAMSQPKTFYILGAGASFGLIPFTPQLRSFIENEYDKIGIYPASTASRSHLFDRVIGDIELDLSNFKRLLLRNISSGTLDLLVQKGLWRPVGKAIPTQYSVFDITGRPSTIFSYNLDGLASAYCLGKHVVLQPHGVHDRFWIESPFYQDFLYATAAYDFVLPHLTPKLLPSPEPTGITDTMPFIHARKFFTQAPALIIIGYSFGQWKGKFDDYESLEYFIDLLRYQPKPVVIISPKPRELVEILQERLSSYNIYGLPIRWELFSATLLNMNGHSFPLRSKWCREQVEELERVYYQIYEKSHLTSHWS